jgi:hypothetical protein
MLRHGQLARSVTVVRQLALGDPPTWVGIRRLSLGVTQLVKPTDSWRMIFARAGAFAGVPSGGDGDYHAGKKPTTPSPGPCPGRLRREHVCDAHGCFLNSGRRYLISSLSLLKSRLALSSVAALIGLAGAPLMPGGVLRAHVPGGTTRQLGDNPRAVDRSALTGSLRDRRHVRLRADRVGRRPLSPRRRATAGPLHP